MDDGVRLAATLYLPATDEPAPCLLEALPYRKDDVTASDRTEYERLRDEYGFAVCRLDLRGTGSSEGVATDEYPAREQDDLVQVISLARGTAVVLRQCRNVGYLVLGVQLAPGRDAPPARAQGNRGDLRHG